MASDRGVQADTSANGIKRPQPPSPFPARHVNVVALGNLCVDIVCPMEELPPKDFEYRRR